MNRTSRNAIAAAAALVALAPVVADGGHDVRAQGPAGQSQAYPFTKAQNTDGARYVWFIFSRAGFAFPYTPARSFPPVNQFKEVPAASAQQADVVWWPTLMGGYSGPADRRVQVADGSLSLDSLIKVKGRPKFFRKQVRRP